MNVLVTGGAGFIGSNFIHHWMKAYPDDKVINLDALTYAGNRENLSDLEGNSNYRFVQGNICDNQLVQSLVSDVDTVVHFAAETHVDRSIMDPMIFMKTNALGTQVLLDEALKAKVKRFHHISTDEVFGSLEKNSQTKFDETTRYDPHSPYSASKASSDHLVRAYGDTFGLPYTITNCSNNYGPFHHPEKLIPLAITNLLEHKKIPVYGNGEQVRDWLFVNDHCRAIEAVLLHAKPMTTYCVGGLMQDLTNIDVIRMILKLMGKSEDEIEFVQDRPGHDIRYAIDWTKIHTELGWEPSVTFEEGLKKTILWYHDHEDWWKKIKNIKFEEYYQKQYTK